MILLLTYSSFTRDPDRISSTSFRAFAFLMLRSNQVFIHSQNTETKKPPKREAFLFVTPTGFKPVTLRAEI